MDELVQAGGPVTVVALLGGKHRLVVPSAVGPVAMVGTLREIEEWLDRARQATAAARRTANAPWWSPAGVV